MHGAETTKLASHFQSLWFASIQFMIYTLQFSPALPWHVQERIMWILSVWTIFAYIIRPFSAKNRRLLTILRQCELPEILSWTWWNRSSIVYCRLHFRNAQFYIGSTEQTMFSREQSLLRKYRQLKKDQLAYYEPALKAWSAQRNYFQFIGFPLLQTDVDKLLAVETACQRTFRPIYNWPWINPLMKQLRIGKQQFGPSTLKTSTQGMKFVKRFRKRSLQTAQCILSRRITDTTSLYIFLYSLGSDTHDKFICSRILRSKLSNVQLIFLLWRLSHHMSEPFRTRAQSQLRYIFKFYATESPPANIPMQLQVLSDTMERRFRQWLLGFTHHHRCNFPIFHKVRAPFVTVKNRTLAQYLYNFRSFLKLWTPQFRPQCACQLFPLHVQHNPRKTDHISSFASECFPLDPILTAHLEDEVTPTWTQFFHQNTFQFEKWLRRWKLRRDLIQYWQAFLQDCWNLQLDSGQLYTQKRIRQARQRIDGLIASPADHFPSSLTLHCPVQWHNLLCKTFQDTSVFHLCNVDSATILKNIQYDLPGWITDRYPWAFDFHLSLSKAYILPKPSRSFMKARPIVNYSRSWPKQMGYILSVVLQDILKVVYPSLLRYSDINKVMNEIKCFFQIDHGADLLLFQTDIAGFYNQVEHDRILGSIEFAIHQYILQHGQTFDSVLQAHVYQHERTLRVFRGQWRQHTKMYRDIRLGDILPICSFLLNHSFFTVGMSTFLQKRGASMGSQWAPIFCAAVALMREHTFLSCFRQFTNNSTFHHRYVDNRVMLLPVGHWNSEMQLFWNLSFYSPPILLEQVEGSELLGYNADVLQRTTTYLQPVDKAFRSTRSSSTTKALTSGALARIRLILQNTWPSSLQIPQIQDFLSIWSRRQRDVLSSTLRSQIIKLVRSRHPQLDPDSLFHFD